MLIKISLAFILNTICVFSQPATLWEVSDMERIATHINPGGEEIDNRYNEPNRGFAYSAVSVPGCPKSIEGNTWLYYGEPPRCFLAGIQGPCFQNQHLAPQRQSPFGICIDNNARPTTVAGSSGIAAIMQHDLKKPFLIFRHLNTSYNFMGATSQFDSLGVANACFG
ncbi:unnamed protein product [Orchesella dallaii]|uniref:Uncharacterized protein n=1 Tax=Orchesella dallaii TaxID=48710 RepID=A0ABP1Q6N0_9HEXA